MIEAEQIARAVLETYSGPFYVAGTEIERKIMSDTHRTDTEASIPVPGQHKVRADLARELERENARLKEWNAERAGQFACTEQRLATEIAHLREDKARLDHLENLIRQCPHAEFNFSDDPGEEKLQGFSICVDGCDPSEVTGKTFREVIDEDMKLTARRNSE